VGDLFAVELMDGRNALGQVLDVSIPHTASCAFLSQHAPTLDALRRIEPAAQDIVATATVVDAHLNRGAWRIISDAPLLLAREQWPNESTRAKGWVGSEVYTGAILEYFLNAYHGLAPWNRYHDPYFLDKILVSPTKKPSGLIYTKK
jgi:hypothetical protein